MSLSAVGGDAWCLLPSRCCHPADAHHQRAIRVDGPADRQWVHVLREKGLVGKSVADAAVIQDLKRAEEEWRRVITTKLAKVEEQQRARKAAGHGGVTTSRGRVRTPDIQTI